MIEWCRSETPFSFNVSEHSEGAAMIPEVIFVCLCFYFESLFLKTFTFEMVSAAFYLHHALSCNNGHNSEVDKQQQLEY